MRVFFDLIVHCGCNAIFYASAVDRQNAVKLKKLTFRKDAFKLVFSTESEDFD